MTENINGIAPWRTKRFLAIGLMTLIFLLTGFANWLIFAELSGAVVTQARLGKSLGNLVVQHVEGGRVSQIFVKEGDKVARNSPLIQFDDTILRSEISILSNRLVALQARSLRLMAEIEGANTIVFPPDLLQKFARNATIRDIANGQRNQFAAAQEALRQESAALDNQISQISIQTDGFSTQLGALHIQSELLTTQLENQEILLMKGLTKRRSVLSLRQDSAVMQGKIGAIITKRAEAQARIAELEIETLRTKSRRREDAIATLRDLELRRAELSQQRSVLFARLDRLLVRAPAGGIVLGLGAIGKNSVIGPGEVVMNIVPQNNQYVANARIAPANINKVFAGQRVRLSFPTLNDSDAASLSGYVDQISADALNDAASTQAYYEVKVALTPLTTRYLAARQDVLPGTPVEIFIQTGKQPVWSYLAKPFLRYFERAFRES